MSDHLPIAATVIGGGIIGLALSHQLAQHGVKVRLLEKENCFGMHQSSRNSGVLHAGLYYKPGSHKAKLATRGIRLMTDFCSENNIPYKICGKLVVATEQEEIPRLQDLLDRGTQNGLRGLRWLKPEEFHEIEPHAAGMAAVHVPEEGIVDYQAVCNKIAEKTLALGGELVTNAKVVGLTETGNKWRIQSTQGEYETPFIINAAGLHCDRVCELTGKKTDLRILPFRGEYFRLREERASLVNGLIYPVPNPLFPFLGVHFTRKIDGSIEAGPNAVLAFAREGYRKAHINVRDLTESLIFPGLWRFLFAYPGMSLHELSNSLIKSRFCSSLQRLVPEIRKDDLTTGGAGVRAQAVLPDGTLLQDFNFAYGRNALHLLNAPSPGATASLAIAEFVMDEIAQKF